LENKLLWVDNFKNLGILAVILGHIASPLGGFIFSFHMPLFFIVAGFFIKFDLTFKEFVSKDFKRLVIPYFIFSVVGLGLEILKRYALHRNTVNLLDELQGVFIWMDMPSLIHTYAFVLWFLPALFFARVILFIVKKNIQNIFIQFLVVFILFSLSFFINLPFGIDNAMNALLFVFIGYIYFRSYAESKILYFLPFVAMVIWIFVGFPALDMASKTYSNIVINILFSISIVYTFIIILKKFNSDNKLLKIWGGNTMLLFIMHPYTNNIAHIVVEKLHFGDWYLKLFISLILLQVLLFLKLKFENKGVFKYV
jgi:fucose 4-O-acetylase-like acetyltransferase